MDGKYIDRLPQRGCSGNCAEVEITMGKSCFNVRLLKLHASIIYTKSSV